MVSKTIDATIHVHEPLAEGLLRFDQLVRIARGAAANEGLRRVQSAPEDHHHVERGMRFRSTNVRMSSRSTSTHRLSFTAIAVV